MPAEVDRIYQFIGVDPLGVEDENPSTQSNATQYPHSQFLHGVGRRVWKPIDRLLSRWAPELGKAIRHVGKQWSLSAGRPPLSEADRTYLWRHYADTTEALEKRFGIDLARWRPQVETRQPRP
jgi:hypothetical protein